MENLYKLPNLFYKKKRKIITFCFKSKINHEKLSQKCENKNDFIFFNLFSP